MLLSAFSVEVLNSEENPLRVKPLSHGGVMQVSDAAHYRPVEIRSQWLRVEVLDQQYRVVGTGWLQWRKGDELLIRYSFLS